MGNNKPKLKKGWDQNLPYKEHALRGKVIAHNTKSLITHFDPELVIPRSEIPNLIKTDEKSLLQEMRNAELAILRIKNALRYQSEDIAAKAIEAKIQEDKEKRAKRNEAPKHILKSEVEKPKSQKRSRVPHIPPMTKAEIEADLRAEGIL